MPSILSQTYALLDTETTGATPGIDKPIEVAIARMENGIILPPKSWFVDPGTPIPPEASAVHHLTDSDVVGQPTLEQLWPEIEKELEGAIIVAHNAPFDRAMLPLLKDRQWLCTLRLARHIWPKGEKSPWGFPLANHQQQVLRYWLRLQVDTMGLSAHRAAADIVVTGELLKAAVARYIAQGGEDDAESMLELIQAPINIQNMPFGKYAGDPLEKVPTEYLEYLVGQNIKKPLDIDLLASLTHELDRRKAEVIISTRTATAPSAEPSAAASA